MTVENSRTSWRPLGVSEHNPLWKRVQMRAEFAAAVTMSGGSVRSMVTEFDIDCSTRRTRNTQIYAFDGPGLTGAVTAMSYADERWDTSPPTSAGDKMITAACAQ